jgi:RHS repeat-associated protein
MTWEKPSGAPASTWSYQAGTGLLLSQTGPDGELVEYGYDAFGNATGEKHTTAAGVVRQTATVYDSLARPTSQSDPKTSVAHTWTYPLNQPGGVSETLTCGTDNPTATTISQDDAGLETQRSSDIGSGTPLIRTVDGRDEAERVTTTTLGGARASHWSFDEADRLMRQWGAGFAANASDTDAYLYDPDTGLKVADHLQLALGGTTEASYGYSAAGRLKRVTIDGMTATHTFDLAGNLKKVVEGQTTTTFAYDEANRLTRMDRTSGNSTHSTYFAWDAANGRRTVQGPSPTSKQITFAYTGSGRLARYANSASGVVASYQYDAAGQRTKSIVSQGGLTTTTTWTYEDITLLELSASRSDGASWRITYLYDEEGVPYAGIYREPADSTQPVVFGMVASDRGDVVELLDRNGEPFAAYRYDVWGNPRANVSSATSLISTALAQTIAGRQMLRYASYCWDVESGLYYCSARSYDPATRQWISKDPEGGDGEESAYQYCGGNPVAGIDPTGENVAWDWLKGLWNKLKGVFSSIQAAYDRVKHFVEVYRSLNPEEKKLAKHHPHEFYHFLSDGDFAHKRTQAWYGMGVRDNTKGNAFQHAYWNALLSGDLGVDRCKVWTDAHEYGFANNRPRPKRMDLHNNKVGRWVYRTYKHVQPNMRSLWIQERVRFSGRLWWFGHGV